jgi:hypothetical protein
MNTIDQSSQTNTDLCDLPVDFSALLGYGSSSINDIVVLEVEKMCASWSSLGTETQNHSAHALSKEPSEQLPPFWEMPKRPKPAQLLTVNSVSSLESRQTLPDVQTNEQQRRRITSITKRARRKPVVLNPHCPFDKLVLAFARRMMDDARVLNLCKRLACETKPGRSRLNWWASLIIQTPRFDHGNFLKWIRERSSRKPTLAEKETCHIRVPPLVLATWILGDVLDAFENFDE